VAAEDGDPGPSTRFVFQLDIVTVITVFAAIVLGMGVFAIARGGSDVLMKITIGVVLALALDSVVQSIVHRWHVSRSIAVAIVGSMLAALATLVVLVLGPKAVEQAQDFSNEIPQTVEQFYDLPIIGNTLEKNHAAEKAQEWLDDLPANISNDAISETAQRLVGGVFSIVVVLFVTFALMLDGDRIVNRGRRLFPERYRDEADNVGRVLHRSIGRYFGGSLTVAALMGIYVLTIGLIFNVPLAPLAAIWAMLTDLIPQVGGFLGGAFLGLLALSNSVTTGIVVVILYVIYMNVENHLISPAIVGQAVNLSPPTTMLAAFIGGAVAGIPGALVATPMLGAAKQIYLGLRFGQDMEQQQQGFAQRWEKVKARFRRKTKGDDEDAPEPEKATT